MFRACTFTVHVCTCRHGLQNVLELLSAVRVYSSCGVLVAFLQPRRAERCSWTEEGSLIRNDVCWTKVSKRSSAVPRPASPWQMPPRSEFTINACLPASKNYRAVSILRAQVVSRLRSSCGDMSEEELGKLSVQLLNCQSAAESRPTFSCTNNMVWNNALIIKLLKPVSCIIRCILVSQSTDCDIQTIRTTHASNSLYESTADLVLIAVTLVKSSMCVMFQASSV